MSVKVFARNSGAGNGCANFMGAWTYCVLCAGKPRFRGGDLGFFLGAGGKCRFCFHGHEDCSEKWSKIAAPSVPTSEALYEKSQNCRWLGRANPLKLLKKIANSCMSKFGRDQSIAQEGVHAIDARNSAARDGSSAAKTSVCAPGLSTWGWLKVGNSKSQCHSACKVGQTSREFPKS